MRGILQLEPLSFEVAGEQRLKGPKLIRKNIRLLICTGSDGFKPRPDQLSPPKYSLRSDKLPDLPGWPKETTLERADFTLQLLMFVTSEKERRMFTIFSLSSFCQLLSSRIQARTG